MKIIKLLTTTILLGATSLIGVANIDVSANSNVNNIPNEWNIIQNKVVEEDDERETPIIETPQAVSTPLTPQGNLTLVDDIVTEGEDESSKQFLTVVSKSGNYFYLIIDRDGKNENVYFLNLVDERDLLDLIPVEEPVEEPVIIEPVIIEPEPEPIPEPEPVEESGSMLPLLLLLGAGGGGAYYYFNFVKPKDEDNGEMDFETEEDDDEDDYDSDEEEEIDID